MCWCWTLLSTGQDSWDTATPAPFPPEARLAGHMEAQLILWQVSALAISPKGSSACAQHVIPAAVGWAALPCCAHLQILRLLSWGCKQASGALTVSCTLWGFFWQCPGSLESAANLWYGWFPA